MRFYHWIMSCEDTFVASSLPWYILESRARCIQSKHLWLGPVQMVSDAYYQIKVTMIRWMTSQNYSFDETHNANMFWMQNWRQWHISSCLLLFPLEYLCTGMRFYCNDPVHLFVAIRYKKCKYINVQVNSRCNCNDVDQCIFFYQLCYWCPWIGFTRASNGDWIEDAMGSRCYCNSY